MSGNLMGIRSKDENDLDQILDDSKPKRKRMSNSQIKAKKYSRSKGKVGDFGRKDSEMIFFL